TALIHQADGLLGGERRDLPMRQIARQAAAPDVDLGIDDLHSVLSSASATAEGLSAGPSSCYVPSTSCFMRPSYRRRGVRLNVSAQTHIRLQRLHCGWHTHRRRSVQPAWGCCLHAKGTRENVFGCACVVAYNELSVAGRNPYDAGQPMYSPGKATVPAA